MKEIIFIILFISSKCFAMADLSEFSFMLIDIDYKIKDTDNTPTIRLFGKTQTERIFVTIRDFLPYFYITQKKGIMEFIEKDPIVKKWKQRVEETKKKRYFGGEELNLIKLSGSHPEQTPVVRTCFEEAGYEIHEADIPFVKRFLLDLGLRGLNIINVESANMRKEKDIVFIEASYKQLKPISKTRVSSADHFYKLKIMAFDIEIDHQKETIQQILSSKSKRIVAISTVWGTNQFEQNCKTFILQEDTNQDEKRVIQEFIDEIEKIQPDVLITFNGDNFDLPYLLARMEKLSIPSALLSVFQNDSVFHSNRYRCYQIKGRISYDISPRTWGIHPISGKKGLGDIAETVLGYGKTEISKTTGNLWRSGFLEGNKSDRKQLEVYSITDSKLTYELTWKLGVQGWLEVIRLTGYPPREAPGSTERIQGEFELMRFARIQEVLIPMAPSDEEVSRRRDERRKNPHTGGTVLIPKGTLHFGVIISDFRSMYPSVCVAHNIGGESLKRVKDIEDANPLELFHSKPQSCLSLMEETLIQRREQTKEAIKIIDQELEDSTDEKKHERLKEERVILDKEQYSMKIVANSMYGSHNYIRSRFYSITLGNAITNIARTYILQMEKLLKDISKKITPVDIIYGDTDSAFIKILDDSYVLKIYNEKNPKKKQKYLEELIDITNSILKNLNSKFPEAMELTLEDIAYKLIFKPGRAKAYSYYSILSGKLNITGFEAVRSDWSKMSRESQKKVLELILKEPAATKKTKEEDIDPGMTKAKQYLIDLGIEIMQMPAEELIPKAIILSPIKKEPGKYKAKVPAVQAFLDFAKREGLDPTTAWKDFDKFQWVITPGKGILSDRAKHPKYVTEIDREHYITEILRASEGFGLKVTLQEIKNKLTTEPIDKIFKRISEDSETGEHSEDSKPEEEIEKKTQLRQMKLSEFFENEES
ncbi:MAG: hypothetical protein KGD59_11960 [Candidatus Heimdallarchaeota archaeon]|nr:hypothetical protein [Candidatus Heimdallarchaeota archaeon]